MARLVSCLVLSLAWGCSSSTPEPAQTTGADPEPTSEPLADTTADPEPAVTAEPASAQASASAPQPREILRKDCLSLAEKYAELVRAEEAAKLNPKLSDAQRETARQNIDKAAKTLADRFAEGCEKSLVGKFADEASLQCAMNSKRLADFDICMNGPAPGASK